MCFHFIRRSALVGLGSLQVSHTHTDAHTDAHTHTRTRATSLIHHADARTVFKSIDRSLLNLSASTYCRKSFTAPINNHLCTGRWSRVNSGAGGASFIFLLEVSRSAGSSRRTVEAEQL